jgi:Tol biopolymer transport system component
MTDQRELDRLLGAFFVEGTNELPDRVLDATLEEVDRTPQRRVTRMPWRFPAMNTYARFVAAAALGVLVIGGALYLGGLRQTGDDQSPTPTASATTSANPSQSAQPHAAVYVFTQGAGTAAECGNSTQGGCISRLWVANLDGTGAHELLPDQTGCQRFQAWSSDGTRLLFSRSECHLDTAFGGMTGLERFYLTDASGSEPQLVDTGCVSPCQADDHGVFSSDGRRILFLRVKVFDEPSATPDPVTGKPAPATELKVLASIDLATGRVTELGDFDQCDRCGTQWPRSDPRWSPDRTQMVFTWAAPAFSPQPPAGGAVFVADADGGNVHQISPAGGAPSWSPDGSRIVLQIDRYEEVTKFEYLLFTDIYTIRPDGTDLRRLTTDEISSNPGWSVDGRIWFIRTPRVDGNQQTEGPYQYWVMDADGTHATQLSGPPQPQDLAGGAMQPAP